MNRRSFFRLAIGAAAVPLIPKPMLALAGPEPLFLDGLQYCALTGMVGTYGGISRLSTPSYPSPGTCLTPAVIRKFNEIMQRRYK